MASNFKKTFFVYYFPALLWVGIIFYFSSISDLKVGSAKIFWEIVFRKIAHVGEYVILAWLVFRIFRNLNGHGYGRSFFSTLVIVFLYAASDEFHQTFIAQRSGNPVDVLVDVLGALFGIQSLEIFLSKKNPKKKITFLFITVLAILIVVFELANYDVQKFGEYVAKPAENLVEPPNNQPNQNQQPVNNNRNNENIIPEALPSKLPVKILIDVPFTSQAPLSVWDAYHEEACEEASLIMVKYFLDKKTLTPQIAEKEIQAMIAFEIKNYGDYTDSNAAQIIQLAKDFYGINNLKAVYDYKEADIQKYLALGKPIIAPMAGRLLGNPNFKVPGPLYHNLVLMGYNGNTIITNDPGTRKGKDYSYGIDVLYKASHEFPGKNLDIKIGRKVLLILE